MLDRSQFSRRALIRRLVADAPPDGALILEGNVGLQHGYADLIGAGLVRLRRRRPVVLLAEVCWEPGSRRLGRILGPLHRGGPEGLAFRAPAQRLIGALDTPDTHYCVLARAEREIFPALWGVDSRRVHFTPFFHFMDRRVEFPPFLEMLEHDGAATANGSVFAGGDSLRDYEPLLAAATSIPARVTIATTKLQGRALPENVEAGPMSPLEFYAAMARASVVVVPLAGGRVRAAGLLTYLNAMALGKVVILTDSLGVSDYVEDRRTGLIVAEGEPQALAEALRWALDPANVAAVRTMAERAREEVRTRYSIDRYLQALLAIAEHGMDIRDRRGPVSEQRRFDRRRRARRGGD